MTTVISTNHAVAIRQVFAEVTRYPLEVLDLAADLEDDLGIDSVKLGEIFSVIRERYQLPEKLDIAAEKVRTIGGISDALHQYLSSGTAQVSAARPVQVAVTGNGVSGAPDPDTVRAWIRQVFAEVTRYPLEVLDLDADLEDDLGIDSVKLGEIFSVIRERYHLPEKLDIAAEKVRTIGGISEALHEYLSAGTAQVSDHKPASVTAAGNGASGAPDPDTVRVWILQIFAEVTRYPSEVLDLDADLEDDLGIDSVKLGEIFSVVRERYQLPEKLDISAEKVRTIGGISDALHQYLSSAKGPAPVVAVVKPTTNGNPAASFREAEAVRKALTGKVGFVSGSGRGLGKDIAVYLAGLGASVIVNSFHSRSRGEETVEQIKADGGDATHIWGSMANPTQLHRIFDEIEERYHKLDFFVSNASNGMLAPIEELTVEHWEKAFRTNVVGLHQGALRAAGMMKHQGGGKIITLSSPAAHGYVEYFGCMGPVKAAVEALTRALAIEFAPYGIQVNCVSPGPIDGELLRKWPDSERLIDQWTAATPRARLIEHREVSHFIGYLLSESVNGFTGSTLVLDAGISAQGW